MPYIRIKSFPKDEAVKNEIAEKINQIFLETWGCPKEAITISMEEIDPKDWEEKVVKGEIKQNLDKMKILSGEKKY